MYIHGHKFILFWLIKAICVNLTFQVLCFNCSSTHRSWTRCVDEIRDNSLALNRTHQNLVNCSEDNAVCFFRSWVARSKHAWIVQRGCYELSTEESPPISLSVISRSMSCKRQRFPDAEYKVCFCQGDRCNGSIDLCLNYPKGLLFLLFVLHLFFYISSLQ
ncbi:unnamed protein product [Parnassius mnemosyne]|uniref:Protein quiver n=1 Tax=Parnassius mnemosyne TaxID=213953 RepID=A0AAV1M3X5_9NEOP